MSVTLNNKFKKLKIVGVTQARTGSSRLPGKVLLKLGGKRLLDWQAAAMKRSKLIDGYIVATSVETSDDAIVEWCADAGVQCIRGSEGDVLSRYIQAADITNADILVRVTGDCPLLDHELVDLVINAFLEAGSHVDHATLEINAFYRGTDVEVFSRAALERLVEMDLTQADREHVTLGMTRRPDLFSLLRVNLPGMAVRKEALRLCIDTPEDLEAVEALIRHLDKNNQPIGWRQIMDVLENNPEVVSSNSHVLQKKVI